MMKRRTTEERGLIMDYKTFKKLPLEKKKDLKIVLFCIGLVCIGFMYDVACDYIMSVINTIGG